MQWRAASGLVWVVSIFAGPCNCQEGVPWIFGHFIERMDCRYDKSEGEYWEQLVALLYQQQTPTTGNEAAQRLVMLSSTLRDLLEPYGVADPVMALHCPLGASAALRELALVCVDVFGLRCAHRALRLMHLSKLLMLFNFNDFGAWFAHSRWQIDPNRWSAEMNALSHEALQADPSVGAAAVKDPNFRQPEWRIGLVSYCNYNDSATKLRVLSGSNKRAYADYHSYSLLHFEKPFVGNAHPWMNKLIAVQENLANYDWLFWVDCDLFFMNPQRTVDALIRTALDRNPEASMIVAEDGMMLNSGAFLLRNNAWSAKFLSKTVDLLAAPMPYSFQHMPWHEQAPLIYLALVPYLLNGLGANGEAPLDPSTSLSNGYDPRVVLVDQRAMNAYPPDVVERTKHAMSHGGYAEGDMVISFNGCSSIIGGERCEELYQVYHDQSMEKFAHSSLLKG